MAIPPDNEQYFSWLNRPNLLVNSFRTKNPRPTNDHYLYIPGNSFYLPDVANSGDKARENVNIYPGRYSDRNADVESETYVLEGPAFVAWPPEMRNLERLDVPLYEFRSEIEVLPSTVGRTLKLWAGPHTETDLPSFSAPRSDPGIPGAAQVYEHTRINGVGQHTYKYDFEREAHNGWPEGYPKFWAMPVRTVNDTLTQAAQTNTKKPSGTGDLTSPGNLKKLADLALPVLKAGGTVNDTNLENMVAFFKGQGLPVRAFTTGIGADASFVLTARMEKGMAWNLAHHPKYSYTSLAGGVGLVGISGGLALGLWWGESEQAVLGHMEGLSYFMVLGAGLGAGLSILLSFTPDGLSYGMTLALTAGVDIDVAGGATYTWFHKAPPPRDKFGKIMFTQ